MMANSGRKKNIDKISKFQVLIELQDLLRIMSLNKVDSRYRKQLDLNLKFRNDRPAKSKRSAYSARK